MPPGMKVGAVLAASGLALAWIATAQQPKEAGDVAHQAAGKDGKEWITYNGNWFEQRYSPLNQINADNIGRLGLAWSANIPAAPGNPQNRQEGTSLVFNGVLYNITPWSVVYALDARTGREMWRSDPEVNQQVWQGRICCGVVNRGIAMWQGKIIAPVVDGRLRALDMATGKVEWETRVSNANMPYTITMAPRVIKGGRIIVGVSGGEYGVRGFFDCYDADNGKQLWRFYTVPGDPSKPFEQPELKEWAKTWEGEWWKLGGGGPVWGGVAYDEATDTVYVGTGQPGPWTDVYRGKGDDLCTDCIIAVRGATGKLVWYYQTTPGDDWDYDSIADITLADLTVNGKLRHVLMHAPKNGFFYMLDRGTGELLSADPWVTVNWSSGVNLKTGRPTINPEARYGTEGVAVMPGPGGGHVWVPWSFNPNTGLVYIPSTSGQPYTYAAQQTFTPLPTDVGPTARGNMNMGTPMGAQCGPPGAGRGAAGGPPPGIDPATGAAAGGRGAGVPPGVDPAQVAAGRGGAGAGAGGGRGGRGGAACAALPTIGPEGRGNMLIAWDPVAQKERWRVPGAAAGYNQGGTLTTAGNLVFADVNTRLMAFRADNGQLLLDKEIGLSQMGPPMTFELDGKQYIAIAGGPAQAPGAGRGGFGGGAGGGRGGAGGRGAGGGRGAAPAGPAPLSHLLVFVLDGTAELPKPPAPAAN